MLTYAKYMENLITILMSSFHLIEVSRTINVWKILCTNSSNYKMSMQHGNKETTFENIHFLHHLSKKLNIELNDVIVSICTRKRFETKFTINDVIKIQDSVGVGVGPRFHTNDVL